MNYGGKGNSILLLKKHGLLVPKTILFDLNQIEFFLNESIKSYKDLLADISLWKCSQPALIPKSLIILREEILQLKAPPEWDNLYNNVFRMNSPVIIRSSMNIEDCETASFSGCFESLVLQSVSEQSLWMATLKVISSAFNTTSILRVLSEGFSLTQMQVGFFIQEWIPHQLAGICCSRNPNHLWEKKGVVEWGNSAEAMSQGFNPIQMANQSDSSPFTLEPFWNKLWHIVKKLEKLKGPIELEWVWDGKKLWIVQVRAIATEEAQLIRNTPKNNRWSREEVLERFPEPLTPLGFSALEDFFDSNLRVLDKEFGIVIKKPKEAIVSLNGYVYANPDLLKFPKIRIRLSHYFAPWRMCFWEFLKISGKFLAKKIGSKQKLPSSIYKIKFLNAMFAEQAHSIISSWDRHRNEHLKKLENFRNKIEGLSQFTKEQTLNAMEELRILSSDFMAPDFSVYFLKEVYFKFLRSLWHELNFPETEFIDLLSSMGNNPTSEMNAEWADLISDLNTDPGYEEFIEKLNASSIEVRKLAELYLKPITQKKWECFFKKNGHIRTSWDLAQPSLGEEPQKLVFILKNFLKGSHSVSKSLTDKPKLALDKLREGIKNLGHLNTLPLVEKTLSLLLDLMKIDEEQHFLSGILFEPSRKLIFHAEQIFLQEGLLKEKGEIFFLTLPEIKEQLRHSNMNLNFLAIRKKTQWERNKINPKPMELSENLQLQKNTLEDNNSLNGYPVSPGFAEGIIHRIEHFEDTRDIPNGAIMLTTSPNPSFVPIYPLLAGMITVTGGPLAHGFLAAREAGLPAVSGISNAFKRIKTGMSVRIDGSTGTVEILK